MTRTYGEVRHVQLYTGQNVWEIDCEAQVQIRFKRLFHRVAKDRSGAIQISDTPENCRELQWFMQRYPMTVDRPKYLKGRAKEFDRRLQLVSSIMSGDYEPRKFTLAKPPWDHQVIAAELLWANHGYLLADKVGLGKTGSAFCAFSEPRTLPALVVTLTHLPRQWTDMLSEFLPDARSHIILRGHPFKRGKDGKTFAVDLAATLERGEQMPDVVVISYSKLAAWEPVLRGHFSSIVFDEVQELRRDASAKYAAAASLSEPCAYRIGLSATPIFNYGGELHEVLDVLAPDCLGTKEEFRREWCREIGNGKYIVSDPETLSSYLREQGLLLRRTASDVGRVDHKPQEIPHHVDADLHAFNDIRDDATRLAKVILAQDGFTNTERFQAAGKFDMALRRATGVAKAPYVTEFCRMLLASEERIVLFGWHHEVYKILGQRLSEFNPVFYTGRESIPQKNATKAAFCGGDSRIMIISLRAGAGMDGLQFVSRACVFGELDWSPGVHAQCMGRLAREGQADQVVAYYLLSDHGTDPIMADILGLKISQSEGLLDPNQPAFEATFEQTGANIKRVAEHYLQQQNIPIPTSRVTSIAASTAPQPLVAFEEGAA